MKIKKLPGTLGMVSLAILLAAGEGFLDVFKTSLKGPRAFTINQTLKRIDNAKNFWYFYDKIKNISENNFRVTLYRLQKKGLIEKKNNKFQLSFSGLKFFDKIKSENKAWDQKWRIVMFDIPEKFRKERHWLRQALYNFKYKPLQKSVFIGKWPLEEDLYKEIKEREIDKYLNLITVGEIDDEKILNSFD